MCQIFKLTWFCYYLLAGSIIGSSININNQDKVINNEKKYSLTIQIEDVIVTKGILYLAIYTNKNDFMKRPYLKEKYFPRNFPKGLVFNLPAGEYAVTIYQDLNNNSRLDKFFSIPIEPYGISNNVRTFPKFEDSKIKLFKDKIIKIKIKN